MIVTLGARGYAVADDRGVQLANAAPADAVVDTTGAGDTFVGALAAALAGGAELAEAARGEHRRGAGRRVARCPATGRSPRRPRPTTTRTRQEQDATQLYLDTDIGTDVDDALALALILGSPELDLVGISTVYGDTALRARLASRLVGLSAVGPSGSDASIPIAPGERETRSGRPVWWPGHEGARQPDLENEAVDTGADGVQQLVDAAAREPGALTVLAIGPLTNIAAALDRSPGFERDVRRLVIMGGDFTEGDRRAGHNILCDVTAAQRVFGSALDIVVGGLDLTTTIRLDGGDVERIACSGSLGRALEAEIAGWWEFHGTMWNNPHDPILALWLTAPQLFASRTASVRVDDDGRTLDEPSDRGSVTVLTGMDHDAVRGHQVDRIAAADAVAARG